MTTVHFDFHDEDGRRIVTLRELGVRKSVRAKVGPPVLVAKVFNLFEAFPPAVFGRLQKAASESGPVTVEAEVVNPGALDRLKSL